MKKYSKKKDLTNFTPIAAETHLEPQFYVEKEIAKLLPPGTMMPISTMRILQKISSPNLSSSEAMELFKLSVVGETNESEKPKTIQNPLTPQLLLTGKLKKKVRKNLELPL